MTRPEVKVRAAKDRNGVSPRALSLARHVDRLPPGEYTIELDKGTLPPQLDFTINRSETISSSTEVGNESPTATDKST